MSPCIGAGFDSTEISGIWYFAPGSDYNADTRPLPKGSAPDIGAQEHLLGFYYNIHSTDIQNPNKYRLHQNYPNPFNPETTIEFSIPITEFVTLKIYNSIGQEIATLISENLTPGEHKYTWDAFQIASGVYFYKLDTESYSSSKKMILLR